MIKLKENKQTKQNFKIIITKVKSKNIKKGGSEEKAVIYKVVNTDGKYNIYFLNKNKLIQKNSNTGQNLHHYKVLKFDKILTTKKNLFGNLFIQNFMINETEMKDILGKLQNSKDYIFDYNNAGGINFYINKRDMLYYYDNGVNNGYFSYEDNFLFKNDFTTKFTYNNYNALIPEKLYNAYLNINDNDTSYIYYDFINLFDIKKSIIRFQKVDI